MNIVLAGMPGSGKTTVSAVFAKRGKKVVDTDEEIVKSHGRIADIFEKYGEQHFRDIESETVEKVSKNENIVISTGGGCLLRNRNVSVLKKSGKIVYLKTTPQTLIERVRDDTERPLLQGGAEERINKLYTARAKIYEASADIIIETDGLTPEQVADAITEKI